jgi:hypothetical protein
MIKSRGALVGSTVGILMGTFLLVCGFVFHPDPHIWYSVAVGNCNIPAAILTTGIFYVFHPAAESLRIVFYVAEVFQWTVFGLFAGSAISYRKERRKLVANQSMDPTLPSGTPGAKHQPRHP